MSENDSQEESHARTPRAKAIRFGCWLAVGLAALSSNAFALGQHQMTGAPTTPVGSPVCDAATAQSASPSGMKIAPINDLNARLPAAPTGALLVPASGSAPAYCLVTGSVLTNATTGKTANFGLALPLKWNGRVIFSGCGGYCGVVFEVLPTDARGGGFPPDALKNGYAIAATDDGHESDPPGTEFDAGWALSAPGKPNMDALEDYFYRAVHAVAVSSRQFVQRWYGAPPSRSYYFGCSDGGREGMVEATRYPADFDGYVIGAPFFDVPGGILGGRAARAVVATAESYIPPALLEVVSRAVYASCDAADGVKDNLIQNPGNCAFKPENLLCKGGTTTNCLTAHQVNTLNAWFSAARDRQGRVASFGFPISDLYDARVPGGNVFAWTEAAGPPRDFTAPEPWGESLQKQPFGWMAYDQSLKYLVFLDPAFDANHRSPVNRAGIVDATVLAQLQARTAAGRGDDPQRLGPFVKSDRKLILYHGYSDGFITPFRTITFYEDWARAAGGYDTLARHARLFMLPGMYHCSKGPGPNFFDALAAIENWVEKGVAPDALVATKYAGDDRSHAIVRTMPLCRFPTQAKYRGTGDVNDAANWSCAPNEDLLRTGPNGKGAGLSSKQ